MQFHHHGYVTTDPRIQRATGSGLNRAEELPDEMDVLIVGTGPAGIITAAQLAEFPDITTRVIERRAGRLEIGQADGLQKRSFETFQAFGFADRLIEEAYRLTESAFWQPDPENPDHIARTALLPDDPNEVSEFPHMVVNQARVADYFIESMSQSASRMKPDYGVEFLDLEVTGEGAYPIVIRVRHTAGERDGEERTVRAKYVVGGDGARSAVRRAIGRKLVGAGANHAWGVMDVLASTDFPDFRRRCVIRSNFGGNILLIPREGGHLARLYVDLGVVGPNGSAQVRATTEDEMIAKANAILHPYSLDAKNIAWSSVYEVGHRIADRFDDVPDDQAGQRTPRVFITGDACHTHSAKAGQGMNVSMQDGFNLAWKLGHVLTGRSPESLLGTYSAERRVIAQDLIDFDKEWSSLMAASADGLESSSTLEEFATKSVEFPAGLMTQYTASMITAEADDPSIAAGFPVGKRFKSARVSRVCDGNPLHLGHLATADGRWRIYVFADAGTAGEESALTRWAQWLTTAPNSPVIRYTPADAEIDSVFDLKVVYQQPHRDVQLNSVPRIFLPVVGPFELTCYENVFSALEGEDIFASRQIDRGGAVVVVRPDQYVAHVVTLEDTTRLASFFEPIMLEPRR